MAEKLYTPLDPTDIPLPGDPSYGGVEPQVPSSADIRTASDKPVKADWKTNYDSRSPRQVLLDEASRDPSKERYPGADVLDEQIAPKEPVYTPIEDTPKQALYTPIEDNKEKPYFAGDPTSDLVNTAQEAGQALVTDPGGLARGIGGGIVGMAGMAQAGIQELNPFSHKPGESYDPVSILDRIEAQGQRATNAVIDPSNQAPLGPGYKAGGELLAVPWKLTGGALADYAKANGFPQVSAAIELAGIYTMIGGMAHGAKSTTYKPTIEDVPKPANSAAVQAVRDFAKDPKNQFDNAATQIANLGYATDKLVGDREPAVFDATKPVKTVLKELANSGEGTVTDALGVLSDHPDVPEHLQEIARAELQRASDLGLDETPVKEGPHPTGKTRVAGSYDYDADVVGIHHQKGFDPQTMLHEIGHAIQSSAIKMFLEDNAVTPVQKGITEIVGRLNEIFEKSRKDYADSLNPTEVGPCRRSQASCG
jgi:hypothetical protein